MIYVLTYLGTYCRVYSPLQFYLSDNNTGTKQEERPGSRRGRSSLTVGEAKRQGLATGMRHACCSVYRTTCVSLIEGRGRALGACCEDVTPSSVSWDLACHKTVSPPLETGVAG